MVLVAGEEASTPDTEHIVLPRRLRQRRRIFS